mgnify:CR=1 FL=1
MNLIFAKSLEASYNRLVPVLCGASSELVREQSLSSYLVHGKKTGADKTTGSITQQRQGERRSSSSNAAAEARPERSDMARDAAARHSSKDQDQARGAYAHMQRASDDIELQMAVFHQRPVLGAWRRPTGRKSRSKNP